MRRRWHVAAKTTKTPRVRITSEEFKSHDFRLGAACLARCAKMDAAIEEHVRAAAINAALQATWRPGLPFHTWTKQALARLGGHLTSTSAEKRGFRNWLDSLFFEANEA